MRRRLVSMMVAAAVILLAMPTAGQSPARSQGDAMARTPDGKPDLQGVWQVLTTAAWDIQDHPAQIGVPAGAGVVEGNDIPYQPWAMEKRNENRKNRMTADPESKCYLPGVPRITYMPFPFQIFQTASAVTMVYEYAHSVRVIYTDRPHFPGALDSWMGESRGRWDGDTLVVDTVHFNDQTWFDRAGNFHSDALHVIERYTPKGSDHLTYDVTIEDPRVFTRPWKMSMPLYRRQEQRAQILEYECQALKEEAEGRLK
jgi:hypothetical protein